MKFKKGDRVISYYREGVVTVYKCIKYKDYFKLTGSGSHLNRYLVFFSKDSFNWEWENNLRKATPLEELI